MDALFATMEGRSREDGTKTFTTWCWEDDALRVGAITKRGYREDRRQRFWELDLVANRAKLDCGRIILTHLGKESLSHAAEMEFEVAHGHSCQGNHARF